MNEKTNPSKQKREEEKENSMEIAKIKVLEALLSRLSDDKATTSGGMSWKSGYEAGVQDGFQQDIALSKLPIQQAQPRPTFQPLYPLQHAVPSSSPLPIRSSLRMCLMGSGCLGKQRNHKPRQYVTIGHH